MPISNSLDLNDPYLSLFSDDNPSPFFNNWLLWSFLYTGFYFNFVDDSDDEPYDSDDDLLFQSFDIATLDFIVLQLQFCNSSSSLAILWHYPSTGYKIFLHAICSLQDTSKIYLPLNFNFLSFHLESCSRSF